MCTEMKSKFKNRRQDLLREGGGLDSYPLIF
jgi:hypothetical protein